jgi:hypothetical protein
LWSGCAELPALAQLRTLRDPLSAAHAIAGRIPEQAFHFSIGSVPFHLHLHDEWLFSSAFKRYLRFTSRPTEAVEVHVDDFFSSDTKRVSFFYQFEGAAVHAFPTEAYFTGVRNEYALDSLLRILMSWVLLPHFGFLLHAATVIRSGRAYVCTGRSGAGKSTVASLSPAGSVLTDEISLLRWEDGEWRAYGTPFWGEFRAEGRNTSAPLAGIFRLNQAMENEVKPLRTAEVLRTLLPNTLFFSAGRDDHGRLLEILGGAASDIPGYDLAFRKDPDFWEVVPA